MRIQNRTPSTIVAPPLSKPTNAYALQKMLEIVQRLPPEAAAEKSIVITELIAALGRCEEIPAEDLQTPTGLLTQVGDYLRLHNAQELGKCFLALGILRTRLYRLVGSLEDYSDSIGVCRQTYRNWTYFAEIAEHFGREAPGLALPGSTELATQLRKLPPEHLVPCWQGYLATPGAKSVGSANSFKKFSAAYRRENGLLKEVGNNRRKTDDEVIGLESLDELLEPERLAAFRAVCPDISPCGSTILGLLTQDLSESERSKLRQAAKLIDRMRDKNSDDYQTFIFFSVRLLVLAAKRQTSEVLADFDRIPRTEQS